MEKNIITYVTNFKKVIKIYLFIYLSCHKLWQNYFKILFWKTHNIKYQDLYHSILLQKINKNSDKIISKISCQFRLMKTKKKKRKVWQNYFEILSQTIQSLRSLLYQHERIFGDEYRSINNKKHSACGYFGQAARCTWCRRFTPYFFQTHPYHLYTRTHTSPEIH